MAKTATLHMRIDPDVKQQAETLYESFGISLSDAVTMFLYKSVMEGGLPFEVRQPRYNAQTEAAMRQARQIMSGELEAEAYDTPAAFLRALEDEDDAC